MKILGDPKLLIDWANGHKMITNLVLNIVMIRVL